jgi:hypothetical protein
MTDQSTTEGHETPPKEAVLEPQEGNETPGNLEPENVESIGEESLQSLASSEATVAPILAHDEGLEAAMFRAPRSRSHCPLMPKPMPR